MSELEKALKRISDWVEKHQLENNGKIVPVLAPGLTPEEIEAKVKDMPFQLSEELYLLYQWRNGADRNGARFYENIKLSVVFEDIKLYASFWCYGFFPLENAFQSATDGVIYQGKYRLPIFSLENGYNCALVDQEKRQTSPIVDDIGSINEYLFPSITDMMVKYAKQMEDGYLWFF
jgi:hypothetical protein